LKGILVKNAVLTVRLRKEFDDENLISERLLLLEIISVFIAFIEFGIFSFLQCC
jgi:hypothetical protein